MLQTVDEIYKVASISLSPNVPAQIFVSQLNVLYVCFLAFRFRSVTPEFSHVESWIIYLQMGLMVNPPKPGDISYDQFIRERYG